jgi:hypothetical protein
MQHQVRRRDVEHFDEHLWSNILATTVSSSFIRLPRDSARHLIGKTVIFLKHNDHDIPPLAERFKGRVGTIKNTGAEGMFYVSFEHAVATSVLLNAHHLLIVE